MEWFSEIDKRLLLWINKDLSNGFFDLFFPWFTDLHKNIIVNSILLPLFLIIFIWFHRRRGVFLVLGLALTVAIDDFIGGKIIKPLFSRPRPNYSGVDVIMRAPEFGGYSFVSNHSANMFCVATFLAFFFPRTSIAFYILALLVGLSRVYTGVHYPFDVIGGAVLGMSIGIIGGSMMKKFLAKREM